MKKMNVFKKAISIAIAVGLVASLTACGGGNKETKETASTKESGVASNDTTQTVFFIMGGMGALSKGYENNDFLKELQDNAGISVSWNTIIEDSLAEQVNIRIAGGDYPDAFMGDGKIYGLPAGEQMGTAGIGAEEDYSIFTVPQFSMINKAWLDQLGLAVSTTLDELHTALQAFAENDMSATYYGNEAGSTIPMSTGFDEWCWGQNIFYAGFGFTNWLNDVCKDLVLNPDGSVEFVCATDNYRQALTYFHDWYAEGLMGEHAEDYVFLPVLDGPDGTHNVTVRTGGATNSGNLSITDEASREKYGKSAGELKGEYEVYGPKLILSEYYSTTFKMEDRAIERLTDLYEFWMPYVDNAITYPMNCVYTEEELDTIDLYKADFESAVAEQEGLWIKNGGPTDAEWNVYIEKLTNSCGMEKLQKVYQDAYNRYISVEAE